MRRTSIDAIAVVVFKRDIVFKVVIVQDSERLQFASAMKTMENDVIIQTNRLQKVMAGSINMNETNFRIFEINMKEIFFKTSCFNSCSRSSWRDKYQW